MNYQDPQTGTRNFRLAAIIVVLIAILFSGRITQTDLSTTAFAQQDLILERRFSQLEQRLFALESRLNRLEQASAFSPSSPKIPTATDAELNVLRSQIETLAGQSDAFRLRLGEVECAVLSLDERTLTPAAREARKKAAAGAADPCRADPSAAIRLSVRP